jgi:hypothetical protein
VLQYPRYNSRPAAVAHLPMAPSRLTHDTWESTSMMTIKTAVGTSRVDGNGSPVVALQGTKEAVCGQG